MVVCVKTLCHFANKADQGSEEQIFPCITHKRCLSPCCASGIGHWQFASELGKGCIRSNKMRELVCLRIRWQKSNSRLRKILSFPLKWEWAKYPQGTAGVFSWKIHSATTCRHFIFHTLCGLSHPVTFISILLAIWYHHSGIPVC